MQLIIEDNYFDQEQNQQSQAPEVLFQEYAPLVQSYIDISIN